MGAQFFSIGVRTVTEELISAPVWWYSRGLQLAFRRLLDRFSYANRYLGVTVWASNLFVPMYGQWDIAGRVISFFVRVVQTVVRCVVFVLWALTDVILFALYIIFPLVVLWRISTTLILLLAQ
ncbi:MAG: hypothetical protein WC052_02700 [Patescibacteria group bacterium]|jgi:hypothetical protein